jgi:hypothetical protein
MNMGRAVARTVSRRFPTAAARDRSRVKSCGISGGQSGIGTGFLQVLRFSYQAFHPLLNTHHEPRLVQQASCGVSNIRLGSIPPPPPK